LRIELTDDLKTLFDEESDNPYYFIIWHPDGKTMIKSKFAPANIHLQEVPESRLARRDVRPEFVRQRGEFRELIRQSRQRWGINILVGRSITPDVAALHEKEGMVALVGVAVLAAGLVGGLWFSRRAIRPIEAISATAAEISLSNLSRRIDVIGTETELTGLARTLNQMFDRIESAFSQQVRFTADASHELRTPVAVILSHAELALDKQRPAEELRETIETCRRSALRMRSLIESLLTLARFDSGEVKIESRWFDLSRTVGDCIALVRPLAAQRRIAIQMDLAPSTATGDPDRIAQVVTNLLTNAIRYNHENGEVNVSLRSSPSEVMLVVSDTGIGIPPEHLAHIFERFYRVDNARSRKDGGVGLGLAICKSIVVAHGGQISVSSHVGRGTKFEVRLPKGGSRPQPSDDAHSEPEERRTNALTASASN
jgi:heavy metal sensor kinase